jgi:hypothetical protein
MDVEKSSRGSPARRRLLGALALGTAMLLATLPAPAFAAHNYSGHGYGGHGYGRGYGGRGGWGGGWGWGPGVYWGGPYYPYYDPYSDPDYSDYYTPPPTYAAPPPAAAPAQTQSSGCQAGNWRQSNGSVVSGTACLQTDGTWRLQ